MGRKILLASLGLFALLALYGCTTDYSKLTDELKPKNLTFNASDDVMNYTNGTCIAMVCQNKTPQFPFNLFFDSSLKEGNCSFQECNETRYQNIVVENGEEATSIRVFMYGAGHSFLSFSDANTYCNNSMKMSVKWLIGNNLTSYPMPSKDRAECFLDKNIIPTYILYSNFTNVNATRAGEIAANLSGAGPLIIVSEAELDINKTRYDQVYSEVSEMKSRCAKCLIALGVKMNGSNEYNVTQDMFAIYPNLTSKIDLVAYGLNSHYFPDCNPDLMLWYANNFSKFVLHTYSKPSLIMYALFDAANSSNNSCKWYNETVGNGYSDLYTYVGPLVSNGVIGASLYSLYGVGPLQCEDCAFIDPNYGADQCNPTFDPKKINPRFFNYMGFCQAYYVGIQEKGTPEEQAKNYTNMDSLMPLVFSNGSKNCNFAFNSNILRYVNESDVEIKPLLDNVEKSEPFFSCAGCFGKGNISTTFTEIPPASQKVECSKYKPQIEIAADNFDMDPTLLRAVVWERSNFAQCDVGYAPKSWISVNPYNLMEIANPNGCCQIDWNIKWYFDVCSGTDELPCKKESDFADPLSCKGEECKPAAYGLAHSTYYPWTIYRDHPSDPIPQAVRVCATKINDAGYPDFNPYRPYDSPCSYAYDFMNTALPAGRNTVASNINALGLDTGTDTENKKEWLSVFFALDNMILKGHQSKPACHGYTETQQDWIDHFNAQKDLSPDSDSCLTCTGGGNYPEETREACCGNKDFMNYVKYCEHNGSFSFAYDTLAKYQSLSDNCEDAYCPDTGAKGSMPDKNIMKYLCENGYVAGAPGVADCCQYARPLPGVYSAWWFCYLNPSTPLSCKEQYCQS